MHYMINYMPICLTFLGLDFTCVPTAEDMSPLFADIVGFTGCAETKLSKGPVDR